MNVLVLDTATETLGIVLQTTEGQIHASILRAGLRHAELLMPRVDRALQDAEMTPGDLDLIVCSRGPGSFTGLRIGMATAKGLALGTGCPLVSVASLDAIAYGVRCHPGTVVPIIDAKKQRVYAALYKSGCRVSEYLDIEPQELLSLANQEGSVLLAGPDIELVASAAEATAQVSTDTRGRDCYSLDMLTLGIEIFGRDGPDKDDAGPMYVRHSDAELSLGRRS